MCSSFDTYFREIYSNASYLQKIHEIPIFQCTLAHQYHITQTNSLSLRQHDLYNELGMMIHRSRRQPIRRVGFIIWQGSSLLPENLLLLKHLKL